MQKYAVVLSALMIHTAFASPTQAQLGAGTSPFYMETRGGLTLPTGELGEITKVGHTTSVGGAYRFNDVISGYLGASYNSFPGDEEAGGVDDPAFDADIGLFGGYAGVQADFAAGTRAPFLRAGLVYYDTRIPGGSDSGRVPLSPGSDFGFQAGAGLTYADGPRLSYDPALIYTRVDEASWFALELGLRFRF